MSDRAIIVRIAGKLGPAVEMLLNGLTTEACIEQIIVLCGGQFPASIEELKGRLHTSIAVLLCPHLDTALTPQDERDLWAVLQKWKIK